MTTTVPPVRVFTFSCFSQRVCVPPHSFPSLLPPPTSFQINSFPAFAVSLSPSPSILSVHLNTHSLFFPPPPPPPPSLSLQTSCAKASFLSSVTLETRLLLKEAGGGVCVCVCGVCVHPSCVLPS